MTIISIDESGYTGPDLTNAAQPNFIVASTILTEEAAKDMLLDAFPKTQAAEYKFKNIWKSGQHKSALPRLCEKLESASENFYIFRLQKRFALFVKMIDYLIEPMFYESGRDFYAPWYAQSYCNTVYRDITHGGTNFTLFNNLTNYWNRLARYPISENLDSLKDYITKEISRNSHPSSTILATLLKGLEFFKKRNGLDNFENTNEIQFTSVLSSVTYWVQQGLIDIEIAHDQSNNFFSYESMWEMITSADQAPGTHVLGNSTTVEFPLGVSRTYAVNSETSFAIQLADVVAGLAAKLVNGMEANGLTELLKECVASGFGQITMGGSSPDTRYVDTPPPIREGDDALDKMTKVLYPDATRSI